VRSTHEGFADAVRWHLTPFRLSGPNPWGSSNADVYVAPEDAETDPPAYSFFLLGQRVGRSRSLPDLLHHFLWKINSIIPEASDDFLFLHSGAVARDGAAVLLPARMDRGKSSLTLALLQAGYDYLSDEFGALDPVTRRAYPVEKRISLEQRAANRFPGLAERLEEPMIDRADVSPEWWNRYVRPEDVGATVGGPAPVRWIVFPTAEWKGPARLEEVGRSAAVEELVQNSFNVHRYDGRGVILLSLIAREAQAFRVLGGTPADRAALLADRLV
jgi:hypothetical protein